MYLVHEIFICNHTNLRKKTLQQCLHVLPKLPALSLHTLLCNDLIVPGSKDSNGYYIVIFYVNLKYVSTSIEFTLRFMKCSRLYYLY